MDTTFQVIIRESAGQFLLIRTVTAKWLMENLRAKRYPGCLKTTESYLEILRETSSLCWLRSSMPRMICLYRFIRMMRMQEQMKILWGKQSAGMSFRQKKGQRWLWDIMPEP